MKLRCGLAVLLALLFFASCDKPEAKPGSAFFEPHQMGEYTPEATPPAPPGTPDEPVELYSWARADRPFKFHSIDDSRATADEWRPLLETPRLARAKAGNLMMNVFDVIVLWPDRNLLPLREFWDPAKERRPDMYVGFGPPFADDYIHLFECGVPDDLEEFGVRNSFAYITDELLAICRATLLEVHVLRDDSFPIVEVPGVLNSALPEVSEKYGRWWLDAVERSRNLDVFRLPRQERPHDAFALVDLYFYIPEHDMRLATEWHARSPLPHEDPAWSGLGEVVDPVVGPLKLFVPWKHASYAYQ